MPYFVSELPEIIIELEEDFEFLLPDILSKDDIIYRLILLEKPEWMQYEDGEKRYWIDDDDKENIENGRFQAEMGWKIIKE